MSRSLAPGRTERTRSQRQGCHLTKDRLLVQNSGTCGCGLGSVSSVPPAGRFVGWSGKRATDAAYPGVIARHAYHRLAQSMQTSAGISTARLHADLIMGVVLTELSQRRGGV